MRIRRNRVQLRAHQCLRLAQDLSSRKFLAGNLIYRIRAGRVRKPSSLVLSKDLFDGAIGTNTGANRA